MASPNRNDSANEPSFPRRPIDRWVDPLRRFTEVQATSGVLLFALTIFALILANSDAADGYQRLIETRFVVGTEGLLLDYPFWYWVNDALMALFFFVIGLEIKRELVTGELREPRKAALPIVAAVGGAALPAAIFVFIVGGGPGLDGWAVPMATDIAFVVGALALFGSKVPKGLTIFVLSLAIVDDLFAVVIVAAFYTAEISMTWLAGALGGIAFIVVMQRLNVRSIPSYVLIGVVVWLCTLKSGVHPTIAGVVIGLMTPARPWLGPEFAAQALSDGARALASRAQTSEALTAVQGAARAGRESFSPLERIEHGLHPWVAFAILPLFVFVNAGVAFGGASVSGGIGLGVTLGLVIGKPVGIMLLSWICVRSGLARLPEGVSWWMLLGASILCGIGFTMALFIAALGLEGELLESAKIGILLGSGISLAAGLAVLGLALRRARAA